MVSAKGKEKVSDNGGKGKRKLGGDDDKTGGGKRKNRGVLQFFDDSAYQVDDDEDSSDESMFDVDDFFEDEFDSDLKFNNEPGKVPKVSELPFVKEEEMSEEEIDRMFENRYKPGAGFVTYAEDGYEHKTSVDKDVYVPSAKDPTIWKVKCMVGRERYSAFCLMQKYVDLEYLGTKLQIISAFALDHVKGFIFIEAEKQNNIYEACNGLCTIYPTRVAPVPNNEMSRLLSARSKSNAISVGTWARVKSGKYKGDLAQVVAVNDARKKVTAKLIPRIDLKAMAEKIGGGVSAKRSVIPPQRLISSSELDEFRPLIHCRKDRDTNEMVEVLDGMMLKDGYLYKKIPIDSLSFWGVMPTEAELLKFEPSKKDESTDVQWLSQLFGEKKKKPVETAKLNKGNGKSDGSSSSTITGNNFELHDLVFFGRKDFGVVIGSEKDGSIKVIKEGSVVVTVKQSELKSASFDKKLFSVLDQHSKTISINDIVCVKNGQLKDRQGVVKKIYKGVLFLFDGSDDESEQENNGYICVKAQLCEKISGEPSHEKGSEPGPSSCADLFSSPQSPLSPDKSYEEKDNKSSFKRDDDAMFSVGQSLRIRMGPLKGYRCRVLAVRRSDVTVKLDSQQKILTVKSENLSEVHGRNPAVSQGEESLSTKPFDFLGTQGGGSDWTSDAALSTEGTAWNAGASTERTSWSALDPSNSSLSKEPGSVDPADDNAKKGTELSSWQTKPTSNENSSWGAAAADKKPDPQAGQVSGWGTNGGWNQATSSVAVNSGAARWGKAVIPDADVPAETRENSSWGVLAKKSSIGGDTSGSKSAWGQSNVSPEKKAGGWGNASGDTAVTSESQWGNCGNVKKDGSPSWGKGSESLSEGGASGQTKNWDTKNGGDDQNDSWNKPKPVAVDSGTAWGKPERTSSWNKKDVGSTDERNKKDGWKKPNVSGEDKESGQNQGWNANKDSPDSGKEWGIPKSDGENRSPGWKNSKGSNTGNASGWGSASTGNEEAGKGKGSWGKETKQNDNNKSSWNTGTTSLEGSPKGNWGSQKASEVNNSGWNQNAKDGQGNGSWKDGNNVGGGSPTGWGNKSNWGKSGTDNGDGNQESSWSNKSNWKSGGGFSENNHQDDSSNDRGGGGGWRGHGGRGGDRGGFRGGRGGSDFGRNQESTWSSKSSWSSRGGFGDNNNSQDDSSNDRGRGGRWSGGRDDRGGFRGRGGSDGGRFGGGRGGGDGEGRFRGRGGGFRGRGRGDWNNNRGGGDSNTEGGWKSSGSGSSWNQTGNDNNNQRQSWNRPSEGGGSWNQGGGGDKKPSQGWGSSTAQDGEWGKSKGDDCSKDLGGASGWGSTNASSPKESHGGWNKPSPKKESGGGWNNKSNESANQNKIEGPATTWGAAAGSGNSSGNWGKSEKNEGPSNTTWGGGGSGKW